MCKAWHRNHAQLAYALKDQAKPDWGAAEQALSKAIEVRDRIGEGGYGSYEFNRATCRIHSNRPKDDIVADLKKAAMDEWVRAYWTLDERSVEEWLKRNKVTAQSLGFP